MYHSVTFGDKNTYDDWHIVPSTRPLFAPPPVKTNYIDLPGSNGKLDLTDVLNGRPVYENRTGSMEFIVLNGFGEWQNRYSEICNYLHGKKMKAVLEDDPAWYYEGRFTVNEWRSEKDWSRIVIDYDVGPFKKEIINSIEPWKWDPFDLNEGVIREFNGLVVDEVGGGILITIPGSTEMVSPLFTVESSDGKGMDIMYNGIRYHLYDGESKNPNLIISQTTSTMGVIGNGRITIAYRGGSL